MHKILDDKPVDAASAQTRDPTAKKQIDDYIRSMTGGFRRVNSLMTKAMIDGAERVLKIMAEDMETLDLSRIGLTPSEQPEILALLRTGQRLRHVNLLGNKFDVETAKTLAAEAREQRISPCGSSQEQWEAKASMKEKGLRHTDSILLRVDFS